MDLVRLSRALRHRLQRRRHDERGAVVVLVAAMTTALFMVAALVVDLGQARVMRQEAQSASDASALAAGNALYLAGVPTANVAGAIAAAKSYAAENYGVTETDWTTCQDAAALAYQAPGTQCISFDHATNPSTVRVIAPLRGVDFVFAPIFGAGESVDISAQAQAAVKLDSHADCGLCVVGDGYHDLQNGDAIISGGDVAINGDVNIQNNGLVSTDGTISVEGEASGPLDGYTPDPLEHQPRIDDPLAYAALPTATGLNPKADPCADGPGTYAGHNFPNGTCTLQAGLYVVTGEWDFTGTSVLDATAGVTLFFTCGTPTAPTACSAPGQDGGWIDAGGNGNISVTAPSSGPTQGMAIIYDRLNTSDMQLSGNGSGSIIGTVYGYSATLRYDGNGSSTNNQALIVVDHLEFNGNPSLLESYYNHNVNMYVPPDGLHLSR